MKHFLLSLLLACTGSFAFSYQHVSVYVVAHEDDWQLFMGLNGYNDIQDPTTKVIFIYTTAGDATFTGPAADMHYVLSRERGALNSVRFCGNIKSLADTIPVCRNTMVSGHMIYHVPYKNVVSYFMRLPDGCFSSGLHGQSLEYLHNRKISSITAVDSSATYTSWNDLAATVRRIIKTEAVSCKDITLNIPEPDIMLNPGDHPDHRFTGRLAMLAADSIQNLEVKFAVGYDIRNRPVNLAADEIAVKAAVFAIGDFGLTENRMGTTFQPDHIAYVSRSYIRTGALPGDDDSAQSNNISVPDVMRVYPSPVGSMLEADVQLNVSEMVPVAITDVAGRTVLPQLTERGTKGMNHLAIPVQSLASGEYLLHLETSTGMQVVKFLKL